VVVRIDGKTFWLFLPGLTDVLIGGEAFERFEAFRKIIGHQEGLQRLFQVVMDENVMHANDLRLWHICRSLPHLLWHSPCRFADDLQVPDDPILNEFIPLECVPPL
jgi:hypothetical protein